MSYQEAAYYLRKAQNCNKEVCDGNDYCEEHRKGCWE